jgi:hypothetical protein
MGYELLRTVDLLNDSLRLVQSNPGEEGADAWIRHRFGITRFDIRMHWGVQILGKTNLSGDITSEAVMLIRTHEGMRLIYRENYLKGLDSKGFIFAATAFEGLTLPKIKHMLNGLFLMIAAERHRALYAEESGNKVYPVCPKARVNG